MRRASRAVPNRLRTLGQRRLRSGARCPEGVAQVPAQASTTTSRTAVTPCFSRCREGPSAWKAQSWIGGPHGPETGRQGELFADHLRSRGARPRGVGGCWPLDGARRQRGDDLRRNIRWTAEQNVCGRTRARRRQPAHHNPMAHGRSAATTIPKAHDQLSPSPPSSPGSLVAPGIHQRLRSRAFVFVSPCNGRRVAFVSADLAFIGQAVEQEVVRRLKTGSARSTTRRTSC
jgi:hypothetical protein